MQPPAAMSALDGSGRSHPLLALSEVMRCHHDAHGVKIGEMKGSSCRHRRALTNRTRPDPRWCLLGVFIVMLAPGPSPAATNQVLAAMADTPPSAAMPMCMGHVDPSESPIGQVRSRAKIV